MFAKSVLAVLPLVGFARAHGCIWHESMWGFNVTATNSPQYGGRDNRPQAPLKGLPFSEWWMHGHLDQPPHPDSVFELPAGGTATTELACDKDATSWWPSGPGGNTQNGNDPCPGPPSKMIHTNGIDDLGGCALAIAYKSDVADVKPEDMVVFSVNHQCIWTRYTDFPVPAKMPACPNGKCVCAWLWQHREDAGGDEMYMNGFQCNVTGATSTTPIPQGKVPVRCADDSSKCVKGPKQPIYWDQADGNNMFDDIYAPPVYLDTYGFGNGAQNDLWDDVADTSAEAKSSSSATSTSSVAPASASSTSAATEASSTSAAATEASSTSVAAAAPVAATSSAAAEGTQAYSESYSPTSAPSSTKAAVSSSTGGVLSSSVALQQVQAASPTTSSSATTTKSGQGHRTCRPKKNKKTSRAVYDSALQRHRRSRRAF